MSKEEVKKPRRKAKPKYEVVCDEPDHLKSIGFDMAWLGNLADQYAFDKFEYLHKFRAFRCYKGSIPPEMVPSSINARTSSETRPVTTWPV